MPKFDLAVWEPEPDLIGPRLKVCTFADHEWALIIEDSQAHLECKDACSDHHKTWMDTGRHGPACDLLPDWHDTMTMHEIPVTVKMVTDYYPGEFGGQGDYDAWLEVTPS